MGASVRIFLLICIIGIIPGVSLGETSSMVIENGHQSVIADFRGDIQSGAAPMAVQYTDISTGSPDEWYWDFGDGTHDSQKNPLHIYTSPGIYSVSLSVTGPSGSDMKTRLGYIKITDTPVSINSQEQMQTISPLTLSTPSPSPTELLSPIPTESPIPTPLSTSSPAPSDSETAILQLLTPTIKADFLPSVNGGPIPLTVSFSDYSTGSPTGWSWDFGDGTSSDLSSPEHVYTTPGKYTVRLTVQGNQGSDTMVSLEPIDVALPPEASIKAQPRTGSAPLMVAFTDNSTGRITSWLWTFGDGTSSEEQNPVHTYNRAGVYDVSLTVSGPDGASDTEVQAMITVTELIEQPVALFSVDTTSGYPPLAVTFTDVSTGDVTTRTWDFGDGTTGAESEITHTYSKSGAYTAALTIKGPAGESHADKVIIVNEPVSVTKSDFTSDVISGVAPLPVTFTDMSSGDVSSWNWDFGDGSSSAETNPVHMYTSAGSYQVVLTVSGPGGSSHSEKGIIVSEAVAVPVSSFSTDVDEGTVPLPVTFTDTSSGEISSWSWDFGDGSSSVEINPVHIYTSAGSYQVILTVSGPGGSSHSEKGIIVSDAVAVPVSSFSTDADEGIAPLAVIFTDTSTGEISSWNWDFGDGSSSAETNPVYTYTSAGSYQAVLTVSGPGGSSHSEKDIIASEPPTSTPTPVITPVPIESSPIAVSELQEPVATPIEPINKPMVAKFSTINNEGSAPLAVRFKDTSTGEITSWDWDFGDGTTSSDQNPSHTYTKAGNYAVALIVTGPEGSQRSDLSMILVTSSVTLPNAVIEVDEQNGTAPLTVVFTDASIGTVTTRNWNFGDGETSLEQDPVHTYSEPGIYTASLIVKGPAGESSTEEQIVVRDISEIPSLQPSNPPVSTGLVQSWNNEPSEIQSVQLETVVPLNTNLSGTPETYPIDTLKQPELTSESPGILITADPTTGPAPLTSSFTSNSAMKVDRYEWLFGDGSSSGEEQPIHTYNSPGTYDITLLIYGPDGQGQKVLPAYITVTEPEPLETEIIAEQNVTVFDTPMPAAPVGPTAVIYADFVNGTAPLKVSFEALPEGKIDGYAWDFGDGGSSYEQNPLHIYSTEGNYSVKLVVAGKDGSNEIRLNSTITVLKGMQTPVCGFTASPVSGYAPLNVSFTDTSSGSIDKYEWSLGDGINSSYQNPTHQYTEPGVYTVGLKVSGQAGNSAEIKTDLITVESIPTAPVARFKADRRSGTAPLEVHFQDLSSGVVSSWNWDLGDGTITDEKDPVMTYTMAGVYAVTQTVIGPGGKDVAIRRSYITVSEPEVAPTAVIYAEPVEGSAPLTVKFLDMSTGLVTGWNWDFGDGSVSSNKNPTHIYLSEGTYSVNLHISGPDGENSTTTLVRVSPHKSTGEKDQYLLSDPQSIQPLSSGTVTFDSDFLNASVEEQDTVSDVSEKPVAAFSLSGRSGKSPLTITFHDRSTGQVTGWQWVFGDGETSDLKDPTHTYQQPGVYTVALAVTGPEGTSQKRIREAVLVF